MQYLTLDTDLTVSAEKKREVEMVPPADGQK